MEQLYYNLLFRWLVGLPMDAAVRDSTVFSKNRDLLEGDIAARFLAAVLNRQRVRSLRSHEHFSVDGSLIEAWASTKSFRPKDTPDDGPPEGATERSFRDEKRSNATHAGTTDPNATLGGTSNLSSAGGYQREGDFYGLDLIHRSVSTYFDQHPYFTPWINGLSIRDAIAFMGIEGCRALLA